MKTPTHPLDDLTAAEITAAAAVVKAALLADASDDDEIRFSYVTLAEPAKLAMAAYVTGEGPVPPRQAEVIATIVSKMDAYIFVVNLGDEPSVASKNPVPEGCQPLFSPDDCFLAEDIVKADEAVCAEIAERYGVDPADFGTSLICDPWSVHVATPDFEPLKWRPDGRAARLIQCFLYWRTDEADNQYAKPIDLLPVVDLNARKVIHCSKQPGATPPKIGLKTNVNYHRASLETNSYLPTKHRLPMKPLDVTQPDGANFNVADGRVVTWDGWSMRLGFNYREGLVIHDARFEGRSVMKRASLVEMAVPYADPNPPFERKCAFDVGDYGLGYCADSLELGCDCLGHIRYFDAVLCDSRGEPYVTKKAICMHEEDMGVLWKHVEYRNGHNEARRARRLVVSFVATVVNYEYLFYWYFNQDGSMEYEIKLSGMLSTNLLSAGERVDGEGGANDGAPLHGVLVAPGVNAQVHQHMFCARLDVEVDGTNNVVDEVDLVTGCVGKASGIRDPFANAFGPVKTRLATERAAVRVCDQTKARTWRVSNPSVINPITNESVGYKLVPFTRGASQPVLLTGSECAVTKKGEFATKNLWVTPHDDSERFPAGEFTPQGAPGQGLPKWTQSDRSLGGERGGDVVLWHAFGVAHVPRPEDFPCMNVEHVGFSFKPDGFFKGNPAIDLPPPTMAGSKEDTSAGTCCAANGHVGANGH